MNTYHPTPADIHRCLLPIARRVPSLRIVSGGAGFDSDSYPALSFISMFSGIEAASVAFNPLGWRAVCFAEIEKFPSRVLAHHYPDVPNVGDMTQHDWGQYRGKVDIVCGGPPCQAFSVAGLRESLNDARGNLSLVYMRALHAIQPRNAIVENVPGWLSTKDNAFGCFLAGLVGASDALPPPSGKRWPNAGMVSGPKGRAAWRVLDAQFFGLAQRRKRVVVVADFGNGADPAAVLFESEGVRRNSPPRRETGKGIAGTIAPSITASGRGFERAGDPRGQDCVIPTHVPQIARCVATREGQSQDFESTTMIAIGVTGQIAHALKAEGADASEDGTGRGNPIVAYAFQPRIARNGRSDMGDLINSLSAQSGETGKGDAAPCVAIAFNHNAQADQLPHNSRDTSINDGLTCSQQGAVALSIAENQRDELRTADISPALTIGGGKPGEGYSTALVNSAVRRLTPRECERLQGFQFRVGPFYPGAWRDNAGRYWSPDYTAIPGAADGPRYKALGNSWAVPKFRWLGARIARFMPPL